MIVHKKINILFIHANNYEIGGSDYCLFKLANTLNRNRFNPIVLLGMQTEIVGKYRNHGIPIIIVPMYRIRKVMKPIYYLKFISNFLPTVIKIVSIIRKYNIDINYPACLCSIITKT